jgi:hypothetical protein
VSRYAHLQVPNLGVKPGWNALGDHFSPALALIALRARDAEGPPTGT